MYFPHDDNVVIKYEFDSHTHTQMQQAKTQVQRRLSSYSFHTKSVDMKF